MSGTIEAHGPVFLPEDQSLFARAIRGEFGEAISLDALTLGSVAFEEKYLDIWDVSHLGLPDEGM